MSEEFSNTTEANQPIINTDEAFASTHNIIQTPEQQCRSRKSFTGIKFIIDACRDDFKHEWHDRDIKGKLTQSAVAIAAPSSQIYERIRIPEILGVTIAANSFTTALEKTGNSAVAIGLSSLALGATVYVQQKTIGKTWIKTAELFPSAYEAVNKQWPKTTKSAQEILPNEKHAIREGAAMFALGTTPFIVAAKTADPLINTKSLAKIEKRVTRRGSLFSGGVAASVFGLQSYAHYIPTKAGEFLTDTSTIVVDTLSSPIKTTAIMIGSTLLGKLGAKIKTSSHH